MYQRGLPPDRSDQGPTVAVAGSPSDLSAKLTVTCGVPVRLHSSPLFAASVNLISVKPTTTGPPFALNVPLTLPERYRHETEPCGGGGPFSGLSLNCTSCWGEP